MTRKQMDSRRALQDWLAKMNLEGNPFEEGNAYEEEDTLPQYFLDIGIFDTIAGKPDKPEFQIIFAPRGSGKSAHAVMLSHKCKPYVRENVGDLTRMLAIPHNQFTSLIEQYHLQHRFTATGHLQIILKHGVQNLIDLVTMNGQTAKVFPTAMLGRLRWFCDQFYPDLLQVDSLNRYFAKSLTRSTLQWKELEQGIAQKKCERLLRDRNAEPGALVLARLVDASARPMSASTSVQELVAEFTHLVQGAGLAGVYILVDQVDATAESEKNPHLVIDLIKPLLEERKLMQGPGWAFKIFLPSDVRDLLCQPGTRLAEFVRRHEIQIQWDDEALRELLTIRLNYFSKDQIQSLEQLCAESADKGTEHSSSSASHSNKKSKTIEESMIEMAEGSPRLLLQLGNYLVRAHAGQEDWDSFLNWTDWKTAVDWFHKDLGLGEIKLRLDPEKKIVFIGTRKEKLTHNELEFLKCLMKNNGRCSRQQLIEQVWGEKDPNAIDQVQVVGQLVKRIREKIEIDRHHPIFLTSEREYGYRLNYYEELEEGL